MSGPLVIAHRGLHHLVRENTLAAFEAAADSGADMIELDVRRTADDRLAVFHDAEVDKQALGRLTYHQLRELSGVDVPLLDDVLGWAAERGIGLDVELKEHGYVDAVAPLLRSFGGPLLVTSFLDPVVAELSDLAPSLKTGLIFSMTTLGGVRRLRECRADAAVLEFRLCKENVVAELASAGVDIYVWDFLPGRADAWLSDARVEGFITDDVPRTLAALNSGV